jgi:hypothetical protein
LSNPHIVLYPELEKQTVEEVALSVSFSHQDELQGKLLLAKVFAPQRVLVAQKEALHAVEVVGMIVLATCVQLPFRITPAVPDYLLDFNLVFVFQ